MQPDYSQLWQQYNNGETAPENQFYNFFLDSLNQFIGTNSQSSTTDKLPVIRQENTSPDKDRP